MVELLAPAGEYNSFKGAISAGADAVYLAGNMYGARASAQNFTTEELIKAIKYAHLFNKKVYLTVNTLTKNEELDKLYSFLKPLYLSGLDAVIVQDIGVFFYIKENFKNLDIHVSTQAVVTSEYGAKFYTDLGAKRVVLARELTLDEIKKINACGIETECFIHGAMCYSYSGMCLFSSFLGGNSGNRGRCKGPCRQPYKINNNEAYYLSLSDMNTIDIIDKLIDSGIYSFKIEGRLKSPSYAAGVTSVYRKYIDKYLENPGKELRIDESDRELLRSLYSRISTGRGYYERVSSKNMITIDKGAYSKVDETLEKEIIAKFVDNPVKKKVDIEFNAFSNNKASLKMIIEINGEIVEVNIESDNPIEKATKLPTSQEDIFKQLKKLGNTDFVLRNCIINVSDGFVASSLINNMRREAVEKLENKLETYLNVRNKNKYETEVIKDKAEISKFFVRKNSDDASGVSNRAFVKNIKQLDFCLKTDFFDSIVVNKDIVNMDLNDSKNINGNSNNIIFENIIKNSSKAIYIELPPVLRYLNENTVKNLIEYAQNNNFIKGIYINQYDQYYFANKLGFDKEICSNVNIYSYNDISSSFNLSLFHSSMFGQELSFNDMKGIDATGLALIMYGKASLMHTANCVLKTTDKCTKFSKEEKNSFVILKDRTGADFKVKLNCDDNLCFNTIINSVPTSLHNYFDKLSRLKISSYLFVFNDESDTEIKEVIDTFKTVYKGDKPNVSYGFTSSHFKNGIL